MCDSQPCVGELPLPNASIACPDDIHYKAIILETLQSALDEPEVKNLSWLRSLLRDKISDFFVICSSSVEQIRSQYKIVKIQNSLLWAYWPVIMAATWIIQTSMSVCLVAGQQM